MLTHFKVLVQNIWLKTKNTESAERQKTSFRKENVENADLHKPVLNKIITTQEWCVKCSFVAPLSKYLFLMDFKLRFLSNNVNGLRSSKKRVKMFEFFKGQIVNNGIIFLQETHSLEDTFAEWRNYFKGEVFKSFQLIKPVKTITVEF